MKLFCHDNKTIMKITAYEGDTHGCPSQSVYEGTINGESFHATT